MKIRTPIWRKKALAILEYEKSRQPAEIMRSSLEKEQTMMKRESACELCSQPLQRKTQPAKKNRNAIKWKKAGGEVARFRGEGKWRGTDWKRRRYYAR